MLCNVKRTLLVINKRMIYYLNGKSNGKVIKYCFSVCTNMKIFIYSNQCNYYESSLQK